VKAAAEEEDERAKKELTFFGPTTVPYAVQINLLLA
jgi:hypothetical protein